MTTTDRARHVVLVGLMGTGKTTVGSMLAERLGRPFVDSDHVIEASTGRTVREIFADEGEAAFRVLEMAALVQALAAPRPAVIAAAGGVVLAEANRRALRDSEAVVVWLQAQLDRLTERAVTGEHRPLLDDDPAGMLARMASEREALYAEVAGHHVDTTSRPPADIVDELAALPGVAT